MPELNEDTVTLTDEQITAAFPGQDLEHIKSMMVKMDGTLPDADANADADADTNADADSSTITYPDYIPEKFRTGTVEEAHQKLAEAHKSLEGKLGKPDAGTADADADADADANADADNNNAKPLTLDDVGAEYQENGGKISEDTYKAFEDKGVGRDVLDGYIAGQEAIGKQLVGKAYSEAGSEEAYTNMVKWASTNWTEAEVEAFDGIVSGTNEAAIMVAVRGLKASYQNAEGSDPDLLLGDGTHVDTTGARYESKAEMTADMKKPEYKKDPAFRKVVEQKIARSNIW